MPITVAGSDIMPSGCGESTPHSDA